MRYHYKEYKSILSPTNGMNIYRGCTHGCIYCDSRSKCYQFDHDFEDIEVKSNAAEMLDRELHCRRRRGMIVTGAMCDPYMHIEEELGITRQCLQVISRHHFGVAVQTKSTRILRDIDLLTEINRKTKAVAQITLTTADDMLCRIIEPAVEPTSERFQALCELRTAGIPTVVWLSPFLPFINDKRENVEALLDYCLRAGVGGIIHFGVGMTLRDGDREYYYAALDRHFPGLKQRYIEKYGNAYEIASDNTHELTRLITDTCRKHNIICGFENVLRYIRDFPDKNEQLSLF